jgi:pyruvate kinase
VTIQPESLAARLPKVGLAHRKGTKIVATLGPSSSSEEMVGALIRAGVDVFRLNFSHGEHETHREHVARIRRVSRDAGRPIAILQDIQGPKIRIGRVVGDEVQLVAGQTFVFTPDPIEATAERAQVSYDRLADDIPVGHSVLVDDGRLELVVTEVRGRDIVCQVIIGGPLRPKKGVNFPGSTMRISILTDKDKRDLELGVELGVDYVAASFVQSASDVLEVKEHLLGLGATTPIIAKIERPQALTNLRDIVLVSEGIMIARGDLGVEIPVEDVPLVQKRIIRLCNDEGKPVITATQMLESMLKAARPTRAEASDVANAILDGTDAVMLSGETAAGEYPVQAVEVMARIAEKAEEMSDFSSRMVAAPAAPGVDDETDAVAAAAVRLAATLGVKAIITTSTSGTTPRLVSRYRPTIPLLCAAWSTKTYYSLCLVWGVTALSMGKPRTSKQGIEEAIEAFRMGGIVSDGDRVVVTCGVPPGIPGSTNLILVERVGADAAL